MRRYNKNNCLSIIISIMAFVISVAGIAISVISCLKYNQLLLDEYDDDYLFDTDDEFEYQDQDGEFIPDSDDNA